MRNFIIAIVAIWVFGICQAEQEANTPSSAQQELRRLWVSKDASTGARCAAVNRCFTNGTPMQVVVTLLGANYQLHTRITDADPATRGAQSLIYRFGKEQISIATSGPKGSRLWDRLFAGAAVVNPKPERKSDLEGKPSGQPAGAANRSQPEQGRLQSRSPDTASSLAESDALAIARLAVATNSAKYPVWLGTNVVYRARREGQRWHVLAEIVHYTASGEPLYEVGGHRFIEIDDHGAVTHYGRGR